MEEEGWLQLTVLPTHSPPTSSLLALSTHRPLDHDVVCLHGRCRAREEEEVVRGWEEAV